MKDKQYEEVKNICSRLGMDSPPPPSNSKYDRFGRNDNCFINYNELDNGDIAVHLGDWSRWHETNTHTIIHVDGGSDITPDHIIRKMNEDTIKQNLESWSAVAKEASALFDTSETDFTHGYLDLKKIEKFLCRLDVKKDTLLVPIFFKGNIVNLQRIYFDKKSNKYVKRFMSGGMIKGCYSMINGDKRPHIYVCEGFATGASINMATGGNVLISMSASNMPSVTENIIKEHNLKTIKFCPDNDKNDVGINAVKKSIEIVGGDIISSVAIPDIVGYDFNDIHVNKGIEEVRNQLAKFKIKEKPELLDNSKKDYLINGILDNDGLGVLHGASGAGKSFIALDLGMRITDPTEKSWNGHEILHHGRFVYFTNEAPDGDRYRHKAWYLGKGKTFTGDLPVTFINEQFSLSDDSGIERVHSLLMDRPDTRLIIFDTLGNYSGMEDENSNTEANDFINRVRSEICIKFGVAVLFVGHQGHGDTGRLRGATAFTAGCDLVVAVKKTDKSEGEIKITKSKNTSSGDKKKYVINDIDTGLYNIMDKKVHAGYVEFVKNTDSDTDEKSKRDTILEKAVSVCMDAMSGIEKNIRNDKSGSPCVYLEKDRLIDIAVNSGLTIGSAKKQIAGKNSKYIKALIDSGYVEIDDVCGTKNIKLSEKFLMYGGFL